jgi:hypothetical protein
LHFNHIGIDCILLHKTVFKDHSGADIRPARVIPRQDLRPGTRYTRYALHTPWLRPWYTHQQVYACCVMQVNFEMRVVHFKYSLVLHGWVYVLKYDLKPNNVLHSVCYIQHKSYMCVSTLIKEALNALYSYE